MPTLTMMKNLTTLAMCAGAFVGCATSSSPSASAGNNASASNSSSAQTKAPAGLPDRDPQLARKLVGEGALLLDVRTQQEFDARHLDKAAHIPVQELDGRLADVDKLVGGDKDKPIVLYCRSGGRAGRAKKMLLKAGHRNVTNMGGIDDWPAD